MPLTGGATVLVPVDVSADDPPATDLSVVPGDVELVLLGYYPVPDQAVPARLKTEREGEASRRLDAVEAAADRPVTRRLVFTHDPDETVERVADEHDCDAVLVPGRHAGAERVFVPLRGRENLERVLSLVAVLLGRGSATATLFHAAGAGEEADGRALLSEAAERLADAGVDPDRVDTRLETTDDPGAAIVGAAREFDLLVVGETEPSLTDRILGRIPTRIVDEVDRPAFVVRDP